MGFQLNIVQNAVYTYSIGVETVVIYSSGASVGTVPITGGAISAAGDTTSSGAEILISAGGRINVATTLPEDPTAAYQQFIADKKLAMASGNRTVTLNGQSQVFNQGYEGYIVSSRLMSLNGVSGYPDPKNACCNININPSIGFWAEQAVVSGTSEPITVLHTTPQCVTCTDYNKLFAAEMVIYHAINNVAWRLLNNDTTITIPGTWYRYEGLIAYWNFLVYKDSFLNYTCSVRENLAVNVGWANPTCDTQTFVCASVVSRTTVSPVSGGYTQVSRMIFYPGAMITSGVGRDNNTYVDGDPIPFIIAYSSANITQGAKVYCGEGGAPASSALLASAQGCMISIGNGSSYSLASIISGGQLLSDIQNFTSRDVTGGWILGIAGRVAGQKYAAIGYTLSPAAGGDAYEFDPEHKDTYTVKTQWWLKDTNGTLSGPYEKPAKSSEFKTYSMQLSTGA